FRYLQEFLELENEAKGGGRGLWSSEAGGLTTSRRASTLGAQGKSEGVTVYITRTGSKYHREGCRSLARSMIPLSLEEAVSRYGPCGICNPPTLGSTSPSPKSEYQRSSASSPGRCQAITKK